MADFLKSSISIKATKKKNRNKELLLVARRDSNVDITVAPQGEAPLSQSPWDLEPALTLGEHEGSTPLLKLLDGYAADSDVYEARAEGEAPVEVDEYRDIDEFM
jgi:hypothetical protein